MDEFRTKEIIFQRKPYASNPMQKHADLCEFESSRPAQSTEQVQGKPWKMDRYYSFCVHVSAIIKKKLCTSDGGGENANCLSYCLTLCLPTHRLTLLCSGRCVPAMPVCGTPDPMVKAFTGGNFVRSWTLKIPFPYPVQSLWVSGWKAPLWNNSPTDTKSSSSLIRDLRAQKWRTRFLLFISHPVSGVRCTHKSD